MRGHVFVVNEETLPVHLEYMFVGVSSKSRDWNISLLADMFRIKRDDFIFFYIEGSSTKKGRFFGIFKAVNNTVYYTSGKDALNPRLPKKLIYRKQIKPYKVFSKGVLEWIALDKLPTYAKELLWTLIYRKMKGKRGNTMLFPWEVNRLIYLIKDMNNGNALSGQYFTFDAVNYQIVRGKDAKSHRMGKPVRLSMDDIKRSEAYLQAYILQNLNINSNTFLPNIFGRNIVWIGNEVFAGSGMQKIDILTIEKIDDDEFLYRLIELKHGKSYIGVNFAPMQLEYYIKWAREDIGGHLINSGKFNIKPILIYFTKYLNSTSKSVILQMKNLSKIANSPEIWEIDYNGRINKIL